MLHSIINAALHHQRCIIPQTLPYIINAALNSQHCITLSMSNSITQCKVIFNSVKGLSFILLETFPDSLVIIAVWYNIANEEFGHLKKENRSSLHWRANCYFSILIPKSRDEPYLQLNFCLYFTFKWIGVHKPSETSEISYHL